LAVAVLVGLVVLSGCGSAGPSIYRGESDGVQMTLKIWKSGPFTREQLTLHFGRGARAVRQRALRTKELRFVCLWPEGPSADAMQSMGLKLKPLARTQVVAGTDVNGSSDGYACALSAPHGPRHSSPEWPATKWLRGAIVAVHLVRPKR
jgi:hypothetical protein